MSDFGIQIKVDAGSAKPTIDGVRDSLKAAEDASNKMRDSMGRFSAGMKEGTDSTEKLKQSAVSMQNPFTSLTDVFKREADMLERIQKPMRDLEEGHQALDALMRKGLVTAEQYTAQLEKLEEAAGKAPSNPAEGLEKGTGFLSGLIGGGVAAEGVEIVKKLFEVTIGEARELEDEYINLKNATLGFKEAGVSTDATVMEQNELADQLHSKLGETESLYGRVAQSATHLGLTHEQLIGATKTFGEASILAGHSLDDAAGFMTRFSLAMQTGQLDARSINTMLEQMPGITKVWADAFHESETKVIQDLADHKISIRQLMVATAEHGKVLDDQMKKHEKTNATEIEEFSTKAKLLAQRYDIKNGFDAVGAAMSREEQLMQHNRDGTLKYYDGLDALDDAMKRVNTAMGDAAAKNHELAAAVGEATEKVSVGAVNAIGDLSGKLGVLAQQIGIMDDKWGSKKPDGFLGAVRVGLADAGKVGDAKLELANLDKAYELSHGHLLDYANRRKSLLETIYGDEQKYLDEIQQPIETYNRRIAELSDLYARGAITAKSFVEQELKLSELLGRRPEVNTNDSFLHGVRGQRAQLFGFEGITAPQLDVTVDEAPTPKEDPQAQRMLELYNSTRTAAEKYKDELAEINALPFNDEARARILDDLATRYGKVRAVAEEFARGQKDLDDKLAVGLITLKAHDEALDDLRVKLNYGADAMVGFREGIRQIDKDINVAADSQKLLVDGFNGIRDAIGSLVTTGTADFGKLVDSLLADAARIAEDKLLRDLLSGGDNGAKTLTNQALSVFGVEGLADGGSFTIPHAADGIHLSPANAGRDDHLLQMYVRTGEDVTVRTPEQQAAARAAANGQGAAPMSVTHAVTIQGLDDRALLAPLGRKAGSTAVIKIIQDNAGLLKAILR